MGYSADGFPLIGPVPDEDGLCIAASFQGSGMVLSLFSVFALVQMMNEASTEALDQWFPTTFRITKNRMICEFKGKVHARASSYHQLKGLL